MYKVYLDKILLPVAPAKITLKTANLNQTITLINDGEINCLKDAGLSEIEFDILLPNVKYPFAEYKSGFHDASYYLENIEKLKLNKQPFQFIVNRVFPNGKALFNTNIKVSLEDYSIEDNAENGFDIIVSLRLKQFRDHGAKTLKVSDNKALNSKPKRSTNTSPAPKTAPKKYTVVSGDCLWTIAKKFYGDGSQWEKIYKANTSVCGKPYTEGGVVYSMIYPGDVLTIPV